MIGIIRREYLSGTRKCAVRRIPISGPEVSDSEKPSKVFVWAFSFGKWAKVALVVATSNREEW